MTACMCNMLGRALWDDDYRQQVFSDPLAACRVYEGPTASARGLRGLTERDFSLLDEQLNSIRDTLGEKVMREVANNFGLQMLLGRAMIEPKFAKQLNQDPDAVAREFLGATETAKNAALVLKGAEYRKLDGFAAQRQAMQNVGKRFSDAVAHSRDAFGEVSGR